MISIGGDKGERAKILEDIIEKKNTQLDLEEEILEEEKILKKMEKGAFKIKIFPCVFYIPTYDTVIWKGKKYKHYSMDLSSYYEGRYLLGEDISQIVEDVRNRIQVILTENKGLEDWTVLGVLLLRAYNMQNED